MSVKERLMTKAGGVAEGPRPDGGALIVEIEKDADSGAEAGDSRIKGAVGEHAGSPLAGCCCWMTGDG